jgi:hypothetical protein
MIAYDLRCAAGHVFEAWFKDRRSFLDQKEAGQVECPRCGDAAVEVAFTGCAVRTERTAPPRGGSVIQHLLTFLQRNFEDVGAQFADEARSIHYGDARRRNIRGTTTENEERGLREEGIDFLKLPLPKLDS